MAVVTALWALKIETHDLPCFPLLPSSFGYACKDVHGCRRNLLRRNNWFSRSWFSRS